MTPDGVGIPDTTAAILSSASAERGPAGIGVGTALAKASYF
jgi:hypothetical protein